ncbi:hypothetical protein ACMHYQ_04520 [Ectopseudomonas guguanensis]|uniref:hypothetical protein n=1 Tax=Ectopseudomonas guguanensis TaxID=1198456 RepID=UPI0039C396F4
MLEFTAEQLERLEKVREDEVIEKLLLEVREHDPAWLAQIGEWPAYRYLKEQRGDAWAFGIKDPEMVELFMRYSLMTPGFQKEPQFIKWMQRPVVDSPEQRFRDYDSIMQYLQALAEWPSAK